MGEDFEPAGVNGAARYQGNCLRLGLTRRQIEIMSLMDKGLSNQEIADILYISKATVKTHINQLFKTFQVNNRINCLRAAQKAGLFIPVHS